MRGGFVCVVYVCVCVVFVCSVCVYTINDVGGQSGIN